MKAFKKVLGIIVLLGFFACEDDSSSIIPAPQSPELQDGVEFPLDAESFDVQETV